MDAERLRRLADDPALVEIGLERWVLQHRSHLLRTRAARQALQRVALLARELDGGRPLAALAARTPPPATYPRLGVRRGLRFALEHGMLTRAHVVHAVRLVRARVRAGARGDDVRLAGMSFLGRHVEFTAPRGPGRIVVGPWSWIGDDVSLRAHAGRITVGSKVIIGGSSSVNAYLDVSIGDRSLLAEGVHLTDFDHRTERLDVAIKDQGIVTAPVRVGPDVWLGRNVTVLRGVDIGQGSVIGAQAVVTRDVPPFSIAVGVPARVVRSRLPKGMGPDEAMELLHEGGTIPRDVLSDPDLR
jgi:acetyltransferase-like isoleucine patch superfamily enzyme